MKKYESEKDILAVVKSFESGTISRADWKHAEHLTVALYYLSLYDFDAAYKKMRDGIFNLLKSFEVDLSKEMPYHETLTVFWLKTVSDFYKSKNDLPGFVICNQLIDHFGKDYPLKFYSRELLFSDKARAKFVTGDLNIIDKGEDL